MTGILAATALNSCKTSEEAVDYKDLSYLYNPTKSPINPSYNVVNQSDNSSVLSIRFSMSDLFFSEANAQGISTSRIMLTVKLYDMKGQRALADTVYPQSEHL